MIIKFKTSKTPRYSQLLKYLINDPTKTKNLRGESLIIKQHLSGLSIKAMSREFFENEKKRIHQRTNNIKLNHEIVSFSDLDKSKITIPMLKDLTQEYLKYRSPFMQAIAVAHFDTEHMHVHIMSSPIEMITGRNMRMSKKDFTKLKTHMQNYQLENYPELSRSIVNHGKNQTLKDIGPMIENHPLKSNKRSLVDLIERCLADAISKEHFMEILLAKGAQPYKRGNDWKGVQYNGKKFRFNTLIEKYQEKFAKLDLKQNNINELQNIREGRNEIEKYIE